MTPDDVRAAAEQLVEFHERFAPLFGKEQAQDHAYTYLKGLMCCPERKSIEPIALCTGTGQVSGLQKFITAAPWPYDDVQAEGQSLFADELAPSATPTPIGVVGVIDESAYAKKGTKSAGVARQHNGRLGKEDNCQVGVFLLGVTPDGVALLDHQLYLHGSWYEGGEAVARRSAAHIPEDLPFRTRPQIAAELIDNVAALGLVTLDWIVADEEYGRDGDWLDELERLGQRYVMEMPVTTTVWTADPAGCVPVGVGIAGGTKTNAPVIWLAHALMERNGLFPAQRPTRHGLSPAPHDGVLSSRRRRTRSSALTIGRAPLPWPLRFRTPKAQGMRFPQLTPLVTPWFSAFPRSRAEGALHFRVSASPNSIVSNFALIHRL
jgi:hypothetical protein